MNVKLKIKLILLFLSITTTSINSQNDCNCDHTYTSENGSVVFVDGSKTQINPGDKICIKSGTYSLIRFINLKGTELNPITITNCGGKVTIDLKNVTNHGFLLSESQHVKLKGDGTNDLKYGFEIYKNPEEKKLTGLVVGYKVSDIEISNFEIHDVELGLHLINVPSCDPTSHAANWKMSNTSVHDMYLHNIQNEGFYIGSSRYGAGHDKECDGEIVNLSPPIIENIKVYNNHIENTGWDGMQLSMAVGGCEIYNNTILNYGLSNIGGQKAGIVVGGGTTGDVYNNFIKYGLGDAIDVFGIGDVKIYNNVILDAQVYGVFIGNRNMDYGKTYFYVLNNTILNSGLNGIRMYNQSSLDNKFYNNIIANSGHTNIYYLGGNGTTIAKDEKTNLLSDTIEELGFVDYLNDDYSLLETSPAVDSGTDISSLGVSNDFSNYPRSGNFDIGAYEFQSSLSTIDKKQENVSFIYPNPTNKYLFIKTQEQISYVTIYDVFGKKVMTSKNTNKINIEFLNAGMYLIQIKRASNSKTLKFNFIKK